MSSDQGHPLAAWRIRAEPFYAPHAGEVQAFEAAYARRVPLVLKGPTGCGKTRFVEHMAWRLGAPLITVACNEDTTATDLLGRWLLDAGGTRWQDGPLTLAARHGAICYLDEIAEARADVLVALHPLSDSRRVLPLDQCGELVEAHPDFQLVAAYNPGHAGGYGGLKPSTRQRLCALSFDYPPAPVEAGIVARESGLGEDFALRLVDLGRRTRGLAEHGLEQGASTRMLVHAAGLIAAGMAPIDACRMALTGPLSDDVEHHAALEALLEAAF